MKIFGIRTRQTIVLFFVLTLGIAQYSLPAHGDEPVDKFLERLREAGYYDTAIDYLTSLESSSLCTDKFRKNILYEKAVTYIEASRGLRDIKKHEQYLDQAEIWLTEFSKTNPAPEMFARSEKMRSQLYYGRGLIYLQLADSDRKTADEIAEYKGKARSLLTQAGDTLEKNRLFMKDKIVNFVEDPERKAESAEQKYQIQREYVQVKVLAALVMESMAETFESGSNEQKAQFEKAIAAHEFNWIEYRSFPEGLLACIGAARCSEQIGKTDEAISYCINIFELENISQFQPFKKQAALIAYKVWVDQEPLPHSEIIGRFESLVNTLSPAEQRQADWLNIQLLLAKAFKAKADKYQGSGKKDTATRKIIKKSNDDAVRIARVIAKTAGPTRELARQLLTQWKIPVSERNEPETQIVTFEQARLRCRDLLVQVEESLLVLNEVKAKIAAVLIPSPELVEEYKAAQEALAESADAVLKTANLAISLRVPETTSEDFANVRYIQAYCYFHSEQYFETIVIGEYLLDRFPSAKSSRDAAALAVKSYLQIYLAIPDDVPPEERDFEYSRLATLTDKLIKHWPGQTATETASVIMSRLSTQLGDVEAAEKYLASIPEMSPGRLNEELRIGQIYWFRYLKAKDRKSEGSQILLAKAKEFLINAVPKLTIEELTPDTARAALSLTDLYLEIGEVTKAVDQLENAKIAPLDLIKQKNKAASSPRFISDTYKTAARVYLAAMQVDNDAPKWIEKTKGVLTGLRQSLVEQDPKTAPSKLRSIYLRIAKESKQQMTRLESDDQKKAFAETLMGFLEAIKDGSTDSQTLLFVGSNLNNIGETMTQIGQIDAARRIHQQAIDAFEKAKKDNNQQADAKVELEIERQLALASRGSGKFDAAIRQFANLLEKNPSFVNIQVDAAKTYQMMGDLKNDASYYAKAMMGGEPRKRENRKPANAIWGWNQLCKSTFGNEKFEAIFAESLYNMCYSRLKYGEMSKRKDALTSARNEILKYAKRSPEMNSMRGEFDKLLKDIQKGLGETQSGLPDKSTNN